MNQQLATRTARLRPPVVIATAGPPAVVNCGQSGQKMNTICFDAGHIRPPTIAPANFGSFQDAGAMINRFTTPAIGGRKTGKRSVAGAQGHVTMH